MYLSKNKFVYHGTTKQNIKVLKPKPHGIIKGEKAVFAGELWFALLCTKNWTDLNLKIGVVNDKPYVKELVQGALDKTYYGGGWLYKLSSKYFHSDSRLATFEYISYNEVPIIESTYVNNVIERLNLLGVKIEYFRPKSKSIYWT